jgi:hypothetical protein
VRSDEALVDQFHITTDEIWCTASEDAHSFFATILMEAIRKIGQQNSIEARPQPRGFSLLGDVAKGKT